MELLKKHMNEIEIASSPVTANFTKVNANTIAKFVNLIISRQDELVFIKLLNLQGAKEQTIDEIKHREKIPTA
jgi:hypothetical protein